MHPLIPYIRERLAPSHPADEAKSLAWWITEELTGLNQTQLILQSECKDTQIFSKAEIILQRLAKKEPIQYIFGHTLWRGMDLKVNSSTLIPRPETSELVDWVLQQHPEPHRSLVDIGTGSGCIALALKQARPLWHIIGMDSSQDALNIARENAIRQGRDITWLHADMLQTIPSAELYVSNPPYVREIDEVDPSVRLYEPANALFVPTNDPLLFYRAIIAHKKEVYFEINEKLSVPMQDLMQQEGYQVETKQDSYGKDRFIHGRVAQ